MIIGWSPVLLWVMKIWSRSRIIATGFIHTPLRFQLAIWNWLTLRIFSPYHWKKFKGMLSTLYWCSCVHINFVAWLLFYSGTSLIKSLKHGHLCIKDSLIVQIHPPQQWDHPVNFDTWSCPMHGGVQNRGVVHTALSVLQFTIVVYTVNTRGEDVYYT